MKSVRVPGQFNSPLIRYISTAKSISLVRVHIEMKINKHEICFDLANFEVSKIYCHTAAKNESADGGGGEHISTILFQRHFTRVSLISCFIQ